MITTPLASTQYIKKVISSTDYPGKFGKIEQHQITKNIQLGESYEAFRYVLDPFE